MYFFFISKNIFKIYKEKKKRTVFKPKIIVIFFISNGQYISFIFFILLNLAQTVETVVNLVVGACLQIFIY